MSTLLDYITGTSDYPLYVAEWLFAAIGAFLHLRQDVKKRNPLAPWSPFSFSWSFFWLDNVPRILATVLFIFIFLRFPEYLLQISVPKEPSVGLILAIAFAIGYYNDKAAEWLKRINFMGIGNPSVSRPDKYTRDENPSTTDKSAVTSDQL